MAYRHEQHHTASGASNWEHRIIPVREQMRIVNGWLRERLHTVLPALMQREQIDMWVVACREYNEDPVFLTMMPEPTMGARRLSILVHALNGDGSVSSYAIARTGIGGDLYQAIWDDQCTDQWQMLRGLVEERNPAKIGIGISHTFAFGDGLSVALHEEMKEALGSYAERFVSAENLAVGWLETRTDSELAAYEGLVAITHGVVAEAFSSRVVHPGVTTDADVLWWIRQRFVDLGLKPWFQPSVSIQRCGDDQRPVAGGRGAERVIMPGDLLHCDVGFYYLRLATDIQQNAYVLRRGETEAPQGIKDALAAGNRLQDIVAGEMKAGRTGNEILKASRAKALAEGLVPCVYCHPLGYHGHAAGPTIGLYDMQEGVPGRGDYPLYESTCHALELNVMYRLPEWNNQEIRMALEQTVLFKDGRMWFFDGRQEHLHLIK